jgi:hypothetical protein
MNLLTQFSEHLTALDRSPATVRGYVTDLTVFSRWLERDLVHPRTCRRARVPFTF